MTALPLFPPELPPLWKHQQKAYDLYRDKPAWFHRWDPRCGKTRGTLEQMEYWMTQRNVRKILVVASKTICSNVWGPETEAFFAIRNPVYSGFLNAKMCPVYSGTLAVRKEGIKRLKGLESHFQLIVVVNYEALHSLEPELLKIGFDAVVVDEIHRFKTVSAQRSLSLKHLRKGARFIRGLSGTPITKNYIDLYGIYLLLDSTIFGTRKEDFIARYCIMDPTIPGQVLLYQNLPELQAKMYSIMDAVYKKDCFDMPERQDIIRRIPLSPKVKKEYDGIAKNHILEANGEVFALDHTLSRLSFLVQFAGGYRPERGPFPGEWVHNEKLDACMEEVSEILGSGKKVVVFHHYKQEGAHLTKAIGPSNCAQIAEHIKGEERNRLIRQFNEGEWPRVLVVQEDIGSEGISLRGADYAIFYSCGLSWATHEQARERTFKPGSEHKLTYIYLRCIGTADVWTQDVIKRQRNVSNALLTTDFAAIAMGVANAA